MLLVVCRRGGRPVWLLAVCLCRSTRKKGSPKGLRTGDRGRSPFRSPPCQDGRRRPQVCRTGTRREAGRQVDAETLAREAFGPPPPAYTRGLGIQRCLS